MFKQIIPGILLIFSLSWNSEGQTSFKVDISNLEESSIILGYHFGSQRLIYDTLEVNGSIIEFSSDSTIPDGLYFLYASTLYLEFIVAEESFEISLDLKDYREKGFVTNSLENQLFTDFQREMGKMQPAQRGLAASLDSLTGADSLAARAQLMEITSQINLYQDSLLDNYEGSFFVEFVQLMRGKQVPAFEGFQDINERNRQRYLYLKKNYFEGIDVTRMMRTPIIHQYVSKYFNDLVPNQPDSINKELDSFFFMIENDEQTFRYWLVSFFNKYQDSNLMGMDAVTVNLVQNYYLSEKVDWITDESRAEMEKELQFILPNLIGKEAPVLNLLDTAGVRYSLTNFDKEFLVLYFYDPDCGVCKKKTPVLFKAYSDIKSEGGEVLAICTITDQEKWKKYILEKELNWYNLADPYYRSNFRAEYNVRSTPQLYILDSSKTIIAKKLDVSQVLSFIKDYKRIMSSQ